jgi:hypothetical protein
MGYKTKAAGTGDQYKYVREKNRDFFPLKYSVSREERLALIQEVGVYGLVLFEYFLRMASIEDIEITDETAAEYFGWNLHTAARWRRALIKAGWFHSAAGKVSNGNKVHLYYLGKAAVIEGQRHVCD